jgi:hypothetical protein
VVQPAAKVLRDARRALFLLSRCLLSFMRVLMFMVNKCLVGHLFLIVRHRGIQRRKDLSELLDTIRMGLDYLAIGIQVVDSGAVHLTLVDRLFNLVCVVSHRFGHGAPLGFLRRSDFELRV